VDKIRRQVAAARRRMVTQQFLGIVAWSLFATLVIAACGLAIPKIWVLRVDEFIWTWSWVGGGLAAGLLIAAAWTYAVRRSPIEAAIEIDHRFQLKERVSSALALTPDELATDIGQALVQDAVRRVDRIDVRDSFGVKPPWRVLLPFVPAAAVFVLLTDLIPDAVPDKPVQASTQTPDETKQVQRSAKKLQERLARAEKKAQDKGLEDTDILFKQLQKGIDDLANKSDVDRKKAMVKINDLAKSMQEKREQLGGVDKMREQLKRLKDIESGPADKIAEAMKEGDFQKALDELKSLQEKLEKGELTEAEKEQLAKQLDQLKNKLQDMVQAHDQVKRELEQEIRRKKEAGDLEGAGKLQRQLDQLNQLNDQMSRLQKMADNLGRCKQCLQDGEGKDAAGELAEIAQSLQEMQQQLDELETLDEMLGEIASAKNAMDCEHCAGAG
jgi:hypothetical protein